MSITLPCMIRFERLACFNTIRDEEGVVRLLFKDVNHAES